jgi:hypothetical protein
MIVLAGLALSSAAEATTCSNASLNVTHGLLRGGTAVTGTPTTSAVQLTIDSTTATFTSVTTASHDGVPPSLCPERTQSPELLVDLKRIKQFPGGHATLTSIRPT